MQLNDIIKDECNTLKKEFNELIPNKNEYILEFNNIHDIDDQIVDVYGKNIKILSAKYQIIGSYDTQCELFTWAWAMQIRDKKITEFEKRICKYNGKIKNYISNNKYTDVQYLEQIMYYISNNTFYIVPANLKTLEDLCIFIGRGKGVLKQNNRELEKSQKIIPTWYLVSDIIGT